LVEVLKKELIDKILTKEAMEGTIKVFMSEQIPTDAIAPQTPGSCRKRGIRLLGEAPKLRTEHYNSFRCGSENLCPILL